MRQFRAMAASVANSTAFLFNTGSAPGSPRHTGQTLVFGGAPKRVEHEQKILDAVRSCTWTSRPMTGSYLELAAMAVSGVLAINRDYKSRHGQTRAGWAGRISPGEQARRLYGGDGD